MFFFKFPQFDIFLCSTEVKYGFMKFANHCFLFIYISHSVPHFSEVMRVQSMLWSLCTVCTSVLVSLLSHTTTPAVPMAALSPTLLTRSACNKKTKKMCNKLSHERSIQWLCNIQCILQWNYLFIKP